jgi:hypothetical protein
MPKVNGVFFAPVWQMALLVKVEPSQFGHQGIIINKVVVD